MSAVGCRGLLGAFKQGGACHVVPLVAGHPGHRLERHPNHLDAAARQLAAIIGPPLLCVYVQSMGAAAVGREPVALVDQDHGWQADDLVECDQEFEFFILRVVSAPEAARLFKNIQVAAVITIPAGMSDRLGDGEFASVYVTINNLNADFTNDIRRSIPDAISDFYAGLDLASPIKIVVQETDLRQQDIQLFQYSVLPTVILVLAISGLVGGGLSISREWETSTMKELLLSPAGTGTIIAGKILGEFVTTCVLGLAVLAVSNRIGWLHVSATAWWRASLIIALVSLLSVGLAWPSARRFVGCCRPWSSRSTWRCTCSSWRVETAFWLSSRSGSRTWRTSSRSPMAFMRSRWLCSTPPRRTWGAIWPW